MRGRLMLLVGIGIAACESSSPRRPAPLYPPAPYPQQPGSASPQGQGVPNAPPRSNDDISRVVNAAYPAFTACYRYSESYMTARSGTVTVFFEIASQGNVLRASDQAPPGIPLDAAALRDARLTACLVQHFYTLSFPAARDETAASWQFSFSP